MTFFPPSRANTPPSINTDAGIRTSVSGHIKKSEDSVATQQRDALFKLTQDLKSPAIERSFDRKVEILASMTQMMGEVSHKKTAGSMLRTLNHQKNRLLFGDASSKAWAHSSQLPASANHVAREFTKLSITNGVQDVDATETFKVLLPVLQNKRSVFASDHKRAFDAIISELKPKRNLANTESITIGYMTGLRQPSDKRLMYATPSEVNRRVGLAPAWNTLMDNIGSLKPARQEALVDTMAQNLVHTNPNDQRTIVRSMGDAYATLLSKHDVLSPALKEHLPKMLKFTVRLMDDAQKTNLQQVLSESHLSSHPDYAFIQPRPNQATV